jgi:hypothetical protein
MFNPQHRKHKQQYGRRNRHNSARSRTTRKYTTAPTYTKHPIQTTTCPTKANYTPHKKQGVIFEAIDDVTIEQYLRAIADHVGGINIKYASRLSGVYLATRTHAQDICAPGGDIPNETLIPLLHTFGKTTSLISHPSISTMHADLKHM